MMNKNEEKVRIHYIDQIKVFLTCLVVAHHAGQAYGPTGGVWPISDASKTEWLGKFFFINASYMMELYFFISGYFMVFSISRKTNGQFVKDRLIRLGIPLLFFTFLVFLPFNYLGSAREMNIFRFFWYTYADQPPIATGHLWFVASLLVYSFIYLLLFWYKGHSKTGVEPRPFRLYYVFIYIILLTVISALVRLKYPIDTWRTWIIPVEVAHIPQYISLFFIGALFNRYNWLESFRLPVGLLFFCIALGAYFGVDLLPASIREYWLTESFTEALLCVGIGMTLLTVFRQYGNNTNRFTRFLAANAYGIYLFHVFIVIALQGVLLNWRADANAKFITVTAGGILFSLLLSMALRRNRTIRKVI